MDPITLGLGLAGALGGSMLTGMLNLWGVGMSNETAASEAHRNRHWMERMSNTAHQREVEDLRKAGLNPILSATGGAGASVPSADTSVNVKAPTWDFGDLGVSNGISAATSAKRIEKIDSEKKLNDATIAQSSSAAELNRVTALGKEIDNGLKIATKQFDIDTKMYGALEARKKYAAAISDLAVKEKQNSWLLSSEGHSAWTREQISKSQGKITKDIVNAVPSVINYWRSDKEPNVVIRRDSNWRD